MCVCKEVCERGRLIVTQGLMGARRPFILITAVADLSVTLATDAAGAFERAALL